MGKIKRRMPKIVICFVLSISFLFGNINIVFASDSNEVVTILEEKLGSAVAEGEEEEVPVETEGLSGELAVGTKEKSEDGWQARTLELDT